MSEATQNRQLRSLITEDGHLKLSLQYAPLPEPRPNEVVVRVEAAPINPSDLFLMFGPADMSEAQVGGDAENPVVTAPIPPEAMPAVAGRVGQSLTVGNEGAGVVVGAGSSDAAQSLMGKTVAMFGGEAFATYCTVDAGMVMPMGEGVTAREAASSFVNPLTALCMVETMREGGYSGMVHTAAASNLGQMLNRICLADGIPLINVVRRREQVELLRELGATHVLDSSSSDFRERLADLIAETGIYLCFDAVGGGRLANSVLMCMEAAATRGKPYNRYGSDTHKQVYIYGRLDLRPTELTPAAGFAFSYAGWLLPHVLGRLAPERVGALYQRIRDEIRTTFASHYEAEISLPEALSPDAIRVYGQRQTGKKYLVTP